MNGRPPSVDLDAKLRTLSVAERREVLHALSAAGADEGPAVDIERFADDSHPDPLLSMYHVHLPKLEATGFVRINRQRGRVRPGPNFDDIEPLLRVIDDHADELSAEWP